MKKLHYEQSGDNYKLKDPYKLIALKATQKTRKNVERFKEYGVEISDIQNSRGDSAYRINVKSTKPVNFQFAHVEESIGTKNVIADELIKEFGQTFYRNIAIDNVASIVNDLSTCGAFPLTFMLHIAAYPNEWYLDPMIVEPLLNGTAEACNMAGLTWGGGESGTDRDIIVSGRSLLSGSATGIIIPAEKVLTDDKIEVGDRIVVFESSGVHTNGITLLRKELVKRLPQGYKTKLSDGRTYGEALLDPSIIYSKLVEQLVTQTEIHYAVHITGHGWRKIMRSKRALTYNIENLPPSLPIFDFIKTNTKSNDRDMYDTYNMGGGFAVFAPAKQVEKIQQIAKKLKIKSYDVGSVKTGSRQVILNPLGIDFSETELVIR